MRVYTVFSPPSGGSDGRADPLNLVFVREGFSWPALIFPVLWLVYRRLWLVLLAYVAVVAGISVLESEIGGNVLAGALPPVVLAGLQFLLALEGNELRRRWLRRRGYIFIGLAGGATLQDAEIGFFTQPSRSGGTGPAAASDHDATPATPASAPAAPSSPTEIGVVGLFPTPEGNAR